MKRRLVGYVAACALVSVASLGAQTYPRNPPANEQPAAQQQDRMVTVEGCLMREADVPGRKPNVAERAGVLEDYILTNVKMVKGSAPAAGTPEPRPGETPTGTSGARATMYEVEGIDDEQLKKHAGHRVQIDGTFENVDRARARPESRTPADDLVELRGTVLRHVSPACSPKP
jgi:hypothetical protein